MGPGVRQDDELSHHVDDQLRQRTVRPRKLFEDREVIVAGERCHVPAKPGSAAGGCVFARLPL